MKIDKPISSGSQLSDEMQREMLEMEVEGSVIVPPVDMVEEVEKLCAADLVRRVRELAPGWDEMYREKFARRIEQHVLEAEAAIAYLRRHRASTDIPEFLREKAAV